MIKLSYTKWKSINDCQGIYFWKYVKGYETISFNIAFVIGDAYETGVTSLFNSNNSSEKSIKNAVNRFDERIKEDRKKLTLSIEDEQDIVNNRIVVQGMVRGYSEFHERDLKQFKLFSTQDEKIINIFEDVILTIKQDNILKYKKDHLNHEIKTVKSIDPKYVENKKFDVQTAMYFHAYNSLFDVPKSKRPAGQKLSEVLYDAVQKPSIRKTQKEDMKGFLKRLGDYYAGPEANQKFYMDRLVPKISWSTIKDSLAESVDTIKRISQTMKFSPSFSKCAFCDYSKLCHEGGETKENLVMFRNRFKNRKGGSTK